MDDARFPARTLVAWFWRTYVRKRLPLLLLAGLFMIAEGAAVGFFSYIVKPMFDQIFVGGDRDAVWWIGSIVFAVFIGRAAAGFTQRMLMATAARSISANMQRDLLAHMLSLDSTFYHEHSPGKLLERVRGDSDGAVSVISTTLSAFGRDLVAAISLLAVAVSIDWLWTLIALAGAPMLLVPIVILQRIIRSTTRTVRDAAARVVTRLDEIFHGIKTIKLSGTEVHESQRFNRDIDTLVRSVLRNIAAGAATPALMDVVGAIGFFGVVVYGGAQIIDGQKTLGEFMSFFTAIALLFEPLRRLGRLSAAWQRALISLERVYSVFDQRPSITSPARPVPLPVPAAEADIALEDVHFAYGEQPVLRGLSFVAEAGKTTALVGPSGAGKSTVFDALTRLIDVQSGRVAIGGIDIRQMDLAELRGLYSVVTQEAQIFDESIRENTLFGQNVDDTELMRALEAAHVTEFLPNLPDGLETLAGPRGSNLSGGQRQRIAIARAILRDTPILLLDEATSALDAKSETIVQSALEDLSAGRTTLVIAHRLATVRKADKIVVMDRGQVVDQGTHDELIARDGIYAGLYRLQFAEPG